MNERQYMYLTHRFVTSDVNSKLQMLIHQSKNTWDAEMPTRIILEYVKKEGISSKSEPAILSTAYKGLSAEDAFTVADSYNHSKQYSRNDLIAEPE